MEDTSTAGTATSWRRVPARWQHRAFQVREKRLTIGRQLRILDPQGAEIAFARQKMFRLREDVRVYADRSRRDEVLRLQATKILDFNANFEVQDPTTGEHLGFVRRKGWSSMVRDQWELADQAGKPYARLEEDSLGMALVRRFLLAIVPGRYHVRAVDSPESSRSVRLRERWQLFGDTYDVELVDGLVDPRVAVALAILLDVLDEAKE